MSLQDEADNIQLNHHNRRNVQMQFITQLMQQQQPTEVNQDQQPVGQQQQQQQQQPQQQQQQNGFGLRRRNFFHFDGSRYFSWLPSFSVEVTHNIGKLNVKQK